MSPRDHAIACAALIVIVGVPATRSDADDRAPRPRATGAIAGSVVDGAGRPVPGATVTAFADSEWLLRSPFEPHAFESLVFEATTDERGLFRIEGTLAGWHDVRIAAAGFAHAEPEDILASPVNPREREIRLEPERRLSGTVVDADGVPVDGAIVEARWHPSGGIERIIAAGRPPMSRADTEADGYFELGGLRVAEYDLVIDAPGFRPLETRLPRPTVSRNDIGRLTLERGVSIEGRVIGPDGAPVADAVVDVYHEPPGARQPIVLSAVPGTPRRPFRTQTDAEGEFRVVGRLSTEQHVVVVSHADWAPARRDLAPPRTGILLVLSHGDSLRGRVVDALTKTPIADAALSSGEGPFRRTTRSDAAGNWSLRGLPSGRRGIGISCDAPGYAPGWIRAPINDAVEFRLVPRALVRGRIVDSCGRPIASARVVAWLPAPSGFHARPSPSLGGCLSDDAGRFTLHGVEPDTDIRIDVRHERFLKRRLILDRLEPGTATTLADIALARGGTVRGRIVDADGEPAADATILLTRTGSTLSATAACRSAQDGTFAIDGLLAGECSLIVRAEDHLEVTVPAVRIQLDAETNVGTVATVRGRSIEGRVVDLLDRPVAGVEIDVIDAAPSGLRLCGAVTDAAGVFRITGLASEDEVEIIARLRDGARRRREYRVVMPFAPRSIEFVLRPFRLVGLRQ